MKQIILVLLSIITITAASQTSISGTITNAKGEVLIGVNVYLEDTYDGGSADVNGKYTFLTEETDSINLMASSIGFETQKKAIVIQSKTLVVDFVLKEKFNELKAVTITAGAFAAGDKKKAAVLSSLEVVTTAGASGDITGALQALPGTTNNGEDGRLFVRGGTGEETQTYINGTIVQTPYSPSPPNTATRGRFNPFLFQGILFSTGGYSAEYGQALSAALILETKNEALEDLLNISISSVSAGLGGIKTFEKGSITADINYTTLQPYFSLSKQNLDWTKPYNGVTGSLNINRKTKKDGSLKIYSTYSLGGFGLDSETINSESGKIKYELENSNYFTNLAWRGILNDNWTMMVGGSYTYDLQKINLDLVDVTKKLQGSHSKIVLKNIMTEKVSVKYGAEIISKDLNENYEDESSVFNQGFDELKPAAFIESQIHASNSLAFSLGVRAENSQLLKQNTLAPRISAAYRMNKKNQISFAYGHFYQDPLDDYLKFSNKINEEKATHYILNYQFKSKGRIARTEVYYKKYDQLVKINNSEEFYLADSYNNSGDGYSYGLDLFYKDSKTVKNGTYWVSYSYLDTKRDFRDYPEEAIPSFSSKHNVSVVYKHWFPELKSMLSSTFNYSSPRNYNDPNSLEFNNELAKPFQSLNLSISYLYRQNIIFFTSLTNVLGHENEFGYEYRNTPNELGIYERRKIEPQNKRFFFIGCFITLTKSGKANQMDQLD